MKARDDRWTTADLERYVDDELDPASRETLAEALRTDASLRAEIGHVRRLDALTRQTLLEPAQPRPHSTLVRRIAILGPVATAAVLLIAVWINQRPAAPPIRREPHQAGAVAAAESPYEPIRVVVTLPIRTDLPKPATRQSIEQEIHAPADIASAVASAAPAELDELLARGNVDAVVSFLASAPRDERVAGYARLGDLLLSARTAERVLDTLSPADQLDVCATWAAEPALRVVAFRRLEKLAGSAELADALAGVVSTLARDEVMRPWLMSYRLLGREGRH